MFTIRINKTHNVTEEEKHMRLKSHIIKTLSSTQVVLSFPLCLPKLGENRATEMERADNYKEDTDCVAFKPCVYII